MNHTEPFEYLEDNSFSFACHPGLSCFTECCRDLRLALTPYDILRLKNRLGLASNDFLDQYHGQSSPENITVSPRFS